MIFLMEGTKIVLLGEPSLREVSSEVSDVKDPLFVTQSSLLAKSLDDFRKKHGFGR